tara:strand:- start:9228 stop:10928 length:1701 start_codon:yes stop_codon:yes gene_type:complete
MTELNIDLDNFIICLDPKLHDHCYNYALNNNKLFIFTYFSEEYGHFYVNYPVKDYYSKEYYIEKCEKIKDNLYDIYLDKYTDIFNINDTIYLNNSNQKLNKRRSKIIHINKNKYRVSGNNIDLFRTIRKKFKIPKYKKPKFLDVSDRDHILMFKYISFIVKIEYNHKYNSLEPIKYNFMEYMWSDIPVINYEIINMYYNMPLFNKIKHYFILSSNKPEKISKIVFNECNMDKYINDSIVYKNNLISVHTNSNGYSIEYMIRDKTDIITNKLENYEYPDCQIEHFPYKHEQCEIWSKKIIQSIKNISPDDDNFHIFAVSIFNKLFNTNIEKLLADTENWNIPRRMPLPITFNTKNEKHMYFIHQLSDLYKIKIDYNKLKTIKKEEYIDIDIDVSNYDTNYKFSILEENIINSLIFFREINYNIQNKYNFDIFGIDSLIAIIDLHRSLVYEEELNIYNYKNNSIKTQLIQPYKNKSTEYHPLYMSSTKCVPENHTIWDSIKIKVSKEMKCDHIKGIIERTLNIKISEIYIKDKNIPGDNKIKFNDYIEIMPLVDNDNVIIIPKIFIKK